MGGAKVAHYCFTWNNPNKDLKGTTWWDIEATRYIIYKPETAPTTGTYHWQGYIQFNKQCSMKKAHEHMNSVKGNGCALIVARGSYDDNKEYISKLETTAGDIYTWGNPVTKAGQRTDVEAFKESIKRGASDAELLEEHTEQTFKYFKAIPFVRQAYQTKRVGKPQVSVYYGDPRSGKSQKAKMEAGLYTNEDDCYVKTSSTGEWWPGYKGQQNVIIDEFYGWIQWSTLLNLLDDMPMYVPIKGGEQQFKATKIWITSNSKPESWYNFEKHPHMRVEALLGRIDKLILYQGSHVEPKVPVTETEIMNRLVRIENTDDGLIISVTTPTKKAKFIFRDKE